MELHEEVLSHEQQTILPTLADFAEIRGFYLGGGTAIALYLRHRKSIDLDWFHPISINDPFILTAEARQRGIHIENVEETHLYSMDLSMEYK